MEKLIDIEANWDGLREYTQLAEKLLNEMIHGPDLTAMEMRAKALLCLRAVNNYTDMANRNILLLHEQARAMLKKVKAALDDTQQADSENLDNTDLEIN